MGNSIIILSENLKFETYQSLDVDMYTFYKQVETILQTDSELQRFLDIRSFCLPGSHETDGRHTGTSRGYLFFKRSGHIFEEKQYLKLS